MMTHIKLYLSHCLVIKVEGDFVVNEVTKIINEWNPADIYPLLSDEYHSEINKIIVMLETVESKSTLANQIFDLFNEFFGGEFRKSYQECEVIAATLLNIK